MSFKNSIVSALFLVGSTNFSHNLNKIFTFTNLTIYFSSISNNKLFKSIIILLKYWFLLFIKIIIITLSTQYGSKINKENYKCNHINVIEMQFESHSFIFLFLDTLSLHSFLYNYNTLFPFICHLYKLFACSKIKEIMQIIFNSYIG